MENEFVPYDLALRMKQLKSMDKGFRHGFNEKTFAYFVEGFPNDKLIISNKPKLYSYEYNGGGPELISAPLFQQAFRWFRENYNLFCEINIDKTMEPKFAYTIMEYESAQFFEGFNEDMSEYLYYKHEEAELACLEKLIEIVEQKEE